MIGFEYVTGSHTAKAIKKQYYSMLKKYNIENKIFKTVADQATNMKKALSEETESNEIAGGANEDNLRRRTGVRLFENLVFCKLNEYYL